MMTILESLVYHILTTTLWQTRNMKAILSPVVGHENYKRTGSGCHGDSVTTGRPQDAQPPD